MKARFSRLILMLALSVTGLNAFAIDSGTFVQGRQFISGGVSDEELQSLYAKREQFSLWVITAARKSGAHLAEVRLKLSDSNQRVVFDRRLDGPWLLIDLPLGRYQIEAVYEGETQKKTTTIHRNDHHQAIFYFNEKTEVSPEAEKLGTGRSKSSLKP